MNHIVENDQKIELNYLIRYNYFARIPHLMHVHLDLFIIIDLYRNDLDLNRNDFHLFMHLNHQ
jgi:hypothetical protein